MSSILSNPTNELAFGIQFRNGVSSCGHVNSFAGISHSYKSRFVQYTCYGSIFKSNYFLKLFFFFFFFKTGINRLKRAFIFWGVVKKRGIVFWGGGEKNNTEKSREIFRSNVPTLFKPFTVPP